MVYSPTNVPIANATIKLFLSRYPKLLHPILRPALYALCDARLRNAMGFPHPSPLVVAIVRSLVKLYGFVLGWFLLPRLWPVTRTPDMANAEGKYVPKFDPNGRKIYKDGYRIEELGPAKVAKDGGLGALGVVAEDSFGWPKYDHVPLSHDKKK